MQTTLGTDVVRLQLRDFSMDFVSVFPCRLFWGGSTVAAAMIMDYGRPIPRQTNEFQGKGQIFSGTVISYATETLISNIYALDSQVVCQKLMKAICCETTGKEFDSISVKKKLCWIMY